MSCRRRRAERNSRMRIRDFSSDAQIHALVAAFENGSLPKAEFRHSAYIAVGLACLADAPLEPATARAGPSTLTIRRWCWHRRRRGSSGSNRTC